MRTKVQRWGNSLGLRIPASFAKEAGIATGSEVELSVRDGSLVIKAARPKRYRLKDLVRRITPENRHDEVDFGRPEGREVW